VAREQGAALIGLLLVVVILGVLATVVLSSGPNLAPSGATSTIAGQTTTTAPRNVASGAALAAIAACRADYELVASAVTSFRAINAAWPASGHLDRGGWTVPPIVADQSRALLDHLEWVDPQRGAAPRRRYSRFARHR